MIASRTNPATSARLTGFPMLIRIRGSARSRPVRGPLVSRAGRARTK